MVRRDVPSPSTIPFACHGDVSTALLLVAPGVSPLPSAGPPVVFAVLPRVGQRRSVDWDMSCFPSAAAPSQDLDDRIDISAPRRPAVPVVCGGCRLRVGDVSTDILLVAPGVSLLLSGG